MQSNGFTEWNAYEMNSNHIKENKFKDVEHAQKKICFSLKIIKGDLQIFVGIHGQCPLDIIYEILSYST